MLKNLLLLLCVIITVTQKLIAQVPALGSYAPANISFAGGNASITPSAAPANVTSAIAYSASDFKGSLVVNPVTGVLIVTNARPAGTFAITIKARNSTSSTTATCTITVGNTTCTNLAVGSYFTNTGVSNCIGTGDFNNDGNQDLVVPVTSSNYAVVRLGNGAGGFTAAANVSIGTNTVDMVTADFNGDGNLDFITAENYPGSFSVRLGNGNGGFSGTTSVTSNSLFTSIAAGDFNADGRMDIVLVSSNSSFALLGNGAGSFSSAGNMYNTSNPVSVAVCD